MSVATSERGGGGKIRLQLFLWIKLKAVVEEEQHRPRAHYGLLRRGAAGLILDRLVALVMRLEVRERERVVVMMREKHLPDIRLHLLSSLSQSGAGREGGW